MLFLLIAEEGAEIAQAASKCLRFTPEHKDIIAGNGDISNLEKLQTEIIDLLTVIHYFNQLYPESYLTYNTVSLPKLAKVCKFLNISKEMGTLQ